MKVDKEKVEIGEIEGIDKVEIEIDEISLIGLREEGEKDRLKRKKKEKGKGKGRRKKKENGFRKWEVEDSMRKKLGEDILRRKERISKMGEVEIKIIRIGMEMRMRKIDEERIEKKKMNGMLRRRKRWKIDVIVKVIGK